MLLVAHFWLGGAGLLIDNHGGDSFLGVDVLLDRLEQFLKLPHLLEHAQQLSHQVVIQLLYFIQLRLLLDHTVFTVGHSLAD